MGDILHALPAVTALRRAHPGWRIGWVVDPRWQALLAAGDREQSARGEPLGIAAQEAEAGGQGGAQMPLQPPLIDRLHLAPVRDWKRRPFSPATLRQIGALRSQLRAARYDAVLDLQGSIRSAVIARLSGCPRRIGEARPREWPARWFSTERIATEGAHVIEQDVELASAVAGDTLQALAPRLPIDPEAEAWCEAWLSERAGDRPLALLLPGAGWGAKRWPPDRYAAVARGLAERGFAVLINAGPGEESLAEIVASGGAATPVAVPLAQLIALTRRMALCVGGDTGPLHLACALGRPVVGLYGPTDPGRNGPYGARARVLRSPASRRDHTRRSAPEAGLLTISPEDVLRAAGELLAELAQS